MNRNYLRSAARLYSAAALSLRTLWAVIGLIMLAPTSGQAAEAITIERRSSAVRVTGAAQVNRYDVLEQTPPPPSGLDLFNASVSDSQSMFGARASSSASQNSSLTFDDVGNLLDFEGSGSFDAQASAMIVFLDGNPVPAGSNAQGSSTFQLFFVVNRGGYRYEVVESHQGIIDAFPLPAHNLASIVLGQLSPDRLELYDKDDRGSFLNESGSPNGELPRGRYLFQGGVSGSAGAFTPNIAGHSVPTSQASGTQEWQLKLIPPIFWNQAVNGNFSDGTKWSAGHPPDADDNATIDVPGLYTIKLDTDVTHKNLHVNGAGVFPTLDLNGKNYTLDEINIGGQDGDDVTFTFDDSSFTEPVVSAAGAGDGFAQAAGGDTPAERRLSARLVKAARGGRADVNIPFEAILGHIDDGGRVNVKTNLGIWEVADLTVGDARGGRLNISDEGTVVNDFAILGDNVNTNDIGQVDINGENSRWEIRRKLVVGNRGGGLVLIDGGTLEGSEIVLGEFAGSSGAIGLIDGKISNESSITDHLVVGGDGNGELNVAGGLVDVFNLIVGLGSSGRGEVNARGGTVMASQSLIVGAAGEGTMTIGDAMGAEGGVEREDTVGLPPDDGFTLIGDGSHITVNDGHLFERTQLTVNGILTIDPTTGAARVGTRGPFVSGRLIIGSEGTLSGQGVIEFQDPLAFGGVNNFMGTVSVGNSPGTLTIDGDYEQTGGLLKIEIAGTAPVEFDVLKVTGDVTLGGDLLLEFIDGFAPRAGDVFEFLDVGGALSGAFASVEVRNLMPGFMFDLRAGASGLTMVALNDGVFVPEPSAALLMLLSGLALLVRRRA